MNEVQSAIHELCGKYGYRDISALIAVDTLQFAAEFPQLFRDDVPEAYVCILQTPEGAPIYCRTQERLFQELARAQDGGKFYKSCPVPDPRENMWMVVGNFESEKEDFDD